MTRYLVGKAGRIINVIDAGLGNILVAEGRPVGRLGHLEVFIDPSTGETMEPGEGYDLYDVAVDELRTNQPVIWAILLDVVNQVRVDRGDAAFDEIGFLQYVVGLFPRGAVGTATGTGAAAATGSTA